MFLYSTVSTLKPMTRSAPASDRILGMPAAQYRMLLTDCGNGGDDFTELELVKNGGLSGGIETNHEDSHLLLAPQAVEQLGEGKTHVGGGL
jgi:hypothetical protein